MVWALGPVLTSLCQCDISFVLLPFFFSNRNDLICLTHRHLNEACITLFVHHVVLARYWYSLQRCVVPTADSLSGFQICEPLPQQFCCSIRTSIYGSVPVCGSIPLSGHRWQGIFLRCAHSFCACLWVLGVIIVVTVLFCTDSSFSSRLFEGLCGSVRCCTFIYYFIAIFLTEIVNIN